MDATAQAYVTPPIIMDHLGVNPLSVRYLGPARDTTFGPKIEKTEKTPYRQPRLI